MRNVSAVMLLFLAVAMVGCNAAKQAGSTPPAGTNITDGSWALTINNFEGGQPATISVQAVFPNDTPVYSAPLMIGYTSCAEDGITYLPAADFPQPAGNTVVGPACFVALGGGCNNGNCIQAEPSADITTSTRYDPGSFTIGVPTNPVLNGSAFNIQYVEVGGWQMDGTGTISNGVASGTWVCDQTTPACSGITGSFTATQH